jgi:hypothetical protein
MAIEHYRIQAPRHGLIVVELEDEANRQDDANKISESLRKLGIAFFTHRIFALSGPNQISIDEIRRVFSSVFKEGDMATMISWYGQEISIIALTPPRTGEGVRVIPKGGD